MPFYCMIYLFFGYKMLLVCMSVSESLFAPSLFDVVLYQFLRSVFLLLIRSFAVQLLLSVFQFVLHQTVYWLCDIYPDLRDTFGNAWTCQRNVRCDETIFNNF